MTSNNPGADGEFERGETGVFHGFLYSPKELRKLSPEQKDELFSRREPYPLQLPKAKDNAVVKKWLKSLPPQKKIKAQARASSGTMKKRRPNRRRNTRYTKMSKTIREQYETVREQYVKYEKMIRDKDMAERHLNELAHHNKVVLQSLGALNEKFEEIHEAIDAANSAQTLISATDNDDVDVSSIQLETPQKKRGSNPNEAGD